MVETGMIQHLLAAALFLSFAAPTAAEPVGYRYEINWGGFRAGEMSITQDEAEGRYRAGMTIHTVGLFDRFLRLRFAAESVGRRVAAVLHPERYQTHYSNRREERRLTLDFDTASGQPGDPHEVLLEQLSPPDDDEPAPPVAPALRAGSLDPLTGLVQIGRHVKAALAGAGPRRFTLANFDGHRRFDYAVEVKGAERLRMGSREFDSVAAIMTMIPLAGFKPRFLSMWESGAYVMHFDPVTGLPLRVETQGFAAATVVTMVGEGGALRPA
jgi:hypothetical protein